MDRVTDTASTDTTTKLPQISFGGDVTLDVVIDWDASAFALPRWVWAIVALRGVLDVDPAWHDAAKLSDDQRQLYIERLVRRSGPARTVLTGWLDDYHFTGEWSGSSMPVGPFFYNYATTASRALPAAAVNPKGAYAYDEVHAVVHSAFHFTRRAHARCVRCGAVSRGDNRLGRHLLRICSPCRSSLGDRPAVMKYVAAVDKGVERNVLEPLAELHRWTPSREPEPSASPQLLTTATFVTTPCNCGHGVYIEGDVHERCLHCGAPSHGSDGGERHPKSARNLGLRPT